MLIHVALALALAETLGLAVVLLVWSDRVAGARLLVMFLCGVSIWIVGNELPNWFGPGAERLALALLATASVTSAVFLHFCIVFCGVDVDRRVLRVGYAIAIAAMVQGLVWVPGRFASFADIRFVAIPNAVGWVTSLVWAALAGVGIMVLLYRLTRVRGSAFNQIAAVTTSCAWGLLCMSGYGIAALDLPFYPWPLLGLPAYPVILVYGILRYRVFVANVWARRALVWTLLLTLGITVVAVTLLLPFESRWLSGLLVAASCLALNGPVRRFAERLIYPGGAVSADDLLAWRSELEAAESLPAMAERATAMLSRRVGTKVRVSIGEPDAPSNDTPCLVCLREAGGWITRLRGWEAAPPGPRYLGELFGSVVSAAALRVEQAQSLAARERERQLQARLAELGSLATTVAHDIRNPLNIIAMAVAAAPAPTRREVAAQVERISHLASDLLDYARPWQVSLSRIDLAEQVRQATSRVPHVSLGAGLAREVFVQADARRTEQALDNLLQNAKAAADVADPDQDPQGAGHRSGRIHVDAEVLDDAVLLHVCDDGPGVPAEIQNRLFEPFASRSVGGTGLGLAIVARIMAAHGGTVALTHRPPWTTSFTLRFPSTP